MDADKKRSLEAKNCGNCKHMTQGPECCFCGHPKAYEGYKEYTYWFFECDQFERCEATKKAIKDNS